MIVPTDRLGLVNFRRNVSVKKNALVERVAQLQGTLNNKQGATKVVEYELPVMKESVESSEKLTATLAGSDKFLEAAKAEVVFRNDDVTPAVPDKVESNKFIAEAG